jgi:hypothetical protein
LISNQARPPLQGLAAASSADAMHLFPTASGALFPLRTSRGKCVDVDASTSFVIDQAVASQHSRDLEQSELLTGRALFSIDSHHDGADGGIRIGWRASTSKLAI